MKKFIAILTAALTMLTLASCGQKLDGDGMENIDTTVAEKTTVAEENTVLALPDPAANVDPEEMEWGWNEYTEEKLADETSDMWYPAGVKKNDTNYIFFNNGHAIYKITDGEEKNSAWVNEDGHVIPDPEVFDAETAFEFDIVFIDNFTLYDYISETYYLRGDLESYLKLFEGKKFTCVTDEGRAIEFKADGIADFYYRGEPEECKWEITAQRIIELKFADYDSNYYVFFNENGTVKCLSENCNSLDNAYYP